MKKLTALFTVLVVLLSCFALADASQTGEDFYYLDTANVLSYEAEAEIYYNNVNLCKATGAQIVVAAIDTTGAKTTEDYAYQMFNQWGIGDKKKDNGILVLMTIRDDDYYVTLGTGTERIIDAGTLKLLLNDVLEPDFAAKRYSEGAVKLFRELFEIVRDFYGVNLAYMDENALFVAGYLGTGAAIPGGMTFDILNQASQNEGIGALINERLDELNQISEKLSETEWDVNVYVNEKPKEDSNVGLYVGIIIVAVIVLLVIRSNRKERGGYVPTTTTTVITPTPAPRRRFVFFSAPRVTSRPRAARAPRAPRVTSYSRPSVSRSSSSSFSSGRSSFSSSRSSSSHSSSFGGGHGGGGSSRGGGAGRGR